MNKTIELLRANAQVSDYKINVHQKESYELFFVKGKLETVRRTNTTDREVTVYVDHEDYKGNAQFFIYPSTTEDEIKTNIKDAVAKALLINNQHYTLPEAATGEFAVASNFQDYAISDLAAKVAEAVFAANTLDNAALNAVEIFITRHTERVLNSRGLDKTQVRYSAMVEAIPTFNGEQQSVELYEQYNFSAFDAAEITAEIAARLAEVKARSAAQPPAAALACPVVLNKLELADLFGSIVMHLNYGTVYSHSNLFSKGDAIQKAPVGDRISITMAGELPGNIASAKFDADGLALRETQIVADGTAVAYYGANNVGQYLGEEPTGSLRCMAVAPGTAEAAAFTAEPTLEILSMSGLQVDFFNDYIGGEVRLAYYHDGNIVTPITGISISGSLTDALNTIRLSQETAVYDSYSGPAKAILQNMKIY